MPRSTARESMLLAAEHKLTARVAELQALQKKLKCSRPRAKSVKM